MVAPLVKPGTASLQPHESRFSETSRTTAKVAYFIASHIHPPQVERLVRACTTGGPDSRVLLHHDQRASALDTSSLSTLKNVDVLPAQTVDWGGFTQCRMVLSSLRWLLQNRDFDWLVYLSGQDYPIKPLTQIESELAAAGADAFLEAKPVEDCNWITAGQRYLYRYYTPPKIKGLPRLMKSLRRHNEATLAAGDHPRLLVPSTRTGAGKIGYRPYLSPFRNGYRCYFGSSWWTLNRKSIEHIISYSDAHPELAGHYRRTLFAPNESFFLTVLMNNPQLRCVTDDSKRFVSWSHPETGHPDMLGVADFERLTKSPDHFARKIDSRTDPRLLDMLDDHFGIER